MKISDRFPSYTKFNPLVPVKCVTPNGGGYIHRFFDTSPFSPSGKYFAVFRMPFEDHQPMPGDEGEVVIIDLENCEEKVVWKTRGWEMQMGCNLQWLGKKDELIFNDVDPVTWKAHAIVLDPATGAHRRLEGGVYQASFDGRHAAASNLSAMRRTQYGYGVIVPDELCPLNGFMPDDDGLYMTDTATGKCELLVSIKKLFTDTCSASERESFRDWRFYGFHAKWSPTDERLIYTVRWYPREETRAYDNLGWCRFNVYTLKPDGTDIRLAVPHTEWEKGGHHINWFPDGQSLSMNLAYERKEMVLMRVGYDGSDLRKITAALPGSGHPSVHPDGRHILTDTYAWEKIAFGDGTIPLRWLDLQTGTEQCLVRIQSATPIEKNDPSLWVDPHPAWNLDWTHFAFNAYDEGKRKVFVADMRNLL